MRGNKNINHSNSQVQKYIAHNSIIPVTFIIKKLLMQINLNLKKPSKIFYFILLLLFFSSLISISFCSLAVYIKILLLLSIILYMTYFYFFVYKNRITQLSFANNQWKLIDAQNKKYLGLLKSSYYLSNHFIIMHFKISGQWLQKNVLVFSDQIAVADYHQLQLLLTCGQFSSE